MLLRLTNANDMKCTVVADDIAMVAEFKTTQPKIFVGTVIGFKNGQDMVVKEKHKEVDKYLFDCLKSGEPQGREHSDGSSSLVKTG